MDQPEDSARLRTVLAGYAAAANQVLAAAQVLVRQLGQERQQKEPLAGVLQRGSWFTGTVRDNPRPDTRVLLEVTSALGCPRR